MIFANHIVTRAFNKNVVVDQRFGELLYAHRKAKRLTQLQLAQQAGISKTYFGRLENSQQLPSRHAVTNLAKALSLTADQLQVLATAVYAERVAEKVTAIIEINQSSLEQPLNFLFFNLATVSEAQIRRIECDIAREMNM